MTVLLPEICMRLRLCMSIMSVYCIAREDPGGDHEQSRYRLLFDARKLPQGSKVLARVILAQLELQLCRCV